MTIPVQTIFNKYTANGVTTVFPYGFKITAAEDLKISVDGVEVTTGFTIDGVGVDGGGNVTFVVAPLNTLPVLVELDPIVKRVTDYQQFGDFPASVVNDDFDRLVLMFQKFLNDTQRSLKLPVDTGTDQVITDNAAARAGKGIKFDASGNLILSTYDPDANGAYAAAVLGDIAPAIHMATNKATPVDADEFGIWDSVTGLLNRLTFANLVAKLAALCSAGWNAATATTATTATNTTNTNGQIPFPATQNPSADANTLDDYEEGIWTPSVGGTATYNAQNAGHYTKIGRVVTVQMYLSVNALGTGSISTISGLPFPASAAIGGQGGDVTRWASTATPATKVNLAINPGATTMVVWSNATAATGSATTSANIASGTLIQASFTYFV